MSLDPITDDVEVVDIVSCGAAVGFIDDGSVVRVDPCIGSFVGAAVGLVGIGVGSPVGSWVGLQVGSGQMYCDISIGALESIPSTQIWNKIVKMDDIASTPGIDQSSFDLSLNIHLLAGLGNIDRSIRGL